MNLSYKAFYFTVKPLQPGTEILIAQLAEVGFESFVETESGVEAYILSEQYTPSLLNELQILSSEEFTITHTTENIQQVNWNKEWEKNFNPIKVGNDCRVRAPFHTRETVTYDIVIEPKMSFGTGHHATTYMMIQHILNEDLRGKRLLDMGCGTGVLAILAEKKGAKSIDAIDIDHWCYLNSIENAERNNCNEISVAEGDASLLKNRQYDVILANINRNILLEDLETYVKILQKKASVFLSGFYKEDLPVIQEHCEKLGLQYENHLTRKGWVAVKFVK